jgi:sugar lactone lactonase YvrE
MSQRTAAFAFGFTLLLHLAGSGCSEPSKAKPDDPEILPPDAVCPASPTATLDFRKLAGGSEHGNVLKHAMPALDVAHRRLYVGSAKTTFIAVIDLDNDVLLDVVDIGVVPSFMMLDATNNLYSASFGHGNDTCTKVSLYPVTLESVETSVCQNLADHQPIAEWNGYNLGYEGFAGVSSGFPVGWRQDLNGAYGVVVIRDASGARIGELPFGPDAMSFRVDSQTGKVFTSNTGDGSVSVFDLKLMASTNNCANNGCFVRDIDIGDSADEIISDSAGRLYMRNRLGGSKILRYDVAQASFSVIDNNKATPSQMDNMNGIGMWPSGMALSRDGQRLFVSSHYGAWIDIVRADTNEVTDRIHFYPAYFSQMPRTDSLSSMAFDGQKNYVYVGWPELGKVGVVDGDNKSVLGVIDLTKYGFDIASSINRGGGLLRLTVNSTARRLYVHLAAKAKLLAFDADTLAKVGEVSIAAPTQTLRGLWPNEAKSLLYVGNKIIDALSLEQTGAFARGNEVVGVEDSGNIVYLYEASPVANNETGLDDKIFKYVAGELIGEWDVGRILEIPSSVIFDFERRKLFVGKFETAKIEQYDLDNVCPPSEATQSETTTPSQNPCGDGVCDAFERAQGACPEDCH